MSHKLKLKSKNQQGSIIVETHKNEILKSKQGMVMVRNHPMKVDTISPESLEEYYDIPKPYYT